MARKPRNDVPVAQMSIYLSPEAALELRQRAAARGCSPGMLIETLLGRNPEFTPVTTATHVMESHPTLGKRCRVCGMLAAACKKHPNCTKEPPK